MQASKIRCSQHSVPEGVTREIDNAVSFNQAV